MKIARQMLDAYNSPIGELSILLTTDRHIATLHQKYMGIVGATDVLTFIDPPEIVISLNTAKRQAKERGVSLKSEVTLLVVHGVLHLVGFDDTNAKAWRKMKQAEVEWIARVIARSLQCCHREAR